MCCNRDTYKTVDFGVFFEHKIERERCQEDDRLHIIEIWNPVWPLEEGQLLLEVGAGNRGTHHTATSADVVNVPFRSGSTCEKHQCLREGALVRGAAHRSPS